MIKNFFTTAIRNIIKHKIYSAINFVGLTCGLSLALLIITYVRSEMSFDKFHKKADRLYRLSYLVPNGLKLAVTPPPIAPLMPEYFPEIEMTARLYNRNVSISKSGGSSAEAFEETDVLFADSSILKMFTFDFVSGDPLTALKVPFTVLITEEMAAKYFGTRNPLGESLLFGGKDLYKVAGVIRDFPDNSHLHFHLLVPYENMYDMETPQGKGRMKKNLETNFVISHSFTYMLLKPGARPGNIDSRMNDFLKKYCPPNRLIGQAFTVMPLRDIHLKSTLQGEPSATNTMANLFVFIAIGILTLIIASINYINLSTAQSLSRTKEIGIRKILGSERSQLIAQFLLESFLFCLISLALSYLIFYFTLPLLNILTRKHLAFAGVVDIPLIISSLLLLLLITLLSGGYPAYFISQFNSITSLKGSKGNIITGSQIFRKSLVIFQLMIACSLLIGSLLLVKQLNFLSTRPLGFQKENLFSIPLFSQNLNSIFSGADSTFQVRLQTFRDRIETYPEIMQTTTSNATPGLGVIYRGCIPQGFTQEDNLFIPDLAVDYDFLTTFGMKMVEGRTFSKDYGTDEREAFLVNETAVKEFHWGSPQQAIGKTIDREGKKGKVIGVIKDFNITSLTSPISSLIIELNRIQWNNLFIKMKNTNVKPAIEKLRVEWNNLFPEKAFQFNFLDEQLNEQYADFDNFGKIIQCFTLIAIAIACLGVYGLVLFSVKRKVKEIGVRKVLGASIPGILKLVYSDFASLTLLGFVLAIPVSYFFIDSWLKNFTYHTEIDWLTYLLAFSVMFIIVAMTIGYQALKASLANPVKSLRSE
jgi:putative ABC transport system permease protein